MKNTLTTLGLLLGIFATISVARAEQCPDKIQYKNGQYLKRGDVYYYNNGTTLINGARLYYSNGSYLKNGDNIYYANGQNLQRGAALYYPNGGYLKNGERLYYANGQFLQNGTSFYHPNGTYARRNGTLYRPDGTITPFPLQLSDKIGDYGTITADVESQKEYITIDFRDLFVNANGVQLGAYWNGASFSMFDIVLNTGNVGEDVYVQYTNNGVTCSLSGTGGGNPNMEFSVDGNAGFATVRVKPGYNPNDVRRSVQNALNALQPTK